MLAPGSLRQIAWVVADLEAGVRHHIEHAGVGSFFRMEGVAAADLGGASGGAPGDWVIDVTIGFQGKMQIELIRPVSGDSIWGAFLDRTGGGVHHLGYEVDDLAAAGARLEAAGFGEMLHLRNPLVEAAYYDTVAATGLATELIVLSDAGRAFFRDLHARQESGASAS